MERRRRRPRHHPRNQHRAGKAPVEEANIENVRGSWNKRFLLITSRWLEYFDGGIPIVEHPHEETEGHKKPNAGNQITSHPHRSGCTGEEICQADQAPMEERQNFNSLQQRLG